MELGGNAAFVVFEDADLDKAVEGAVLAKMRNSGEACTAANRIFVHSQVMDEFSQKLAERLGRMKTGRGVDEETAVGPMVDARQRDKVAELVEDAVKSGAKVVLGGEPPRVRVLLPADGADRRSRERAHVVRGDLRTGGPADAVRR